MSEPRERVVKADADAGWQNCFAIQAHADLSDVESKARELADFGLGKGLSALWHKADLLAGGDGAVGHQMDACEVIATESMQRLRPDGVTRLGLYIESLRTILRDRFPNGRVLDFGCSAWIDASYSLVRDRFRYDIQLMDISPLPLAFARWQLEQRGVNPVVSQVHDVGTELDLVADDVVMIVESTAFEHVKDIRHLFEGLLGKLPPGGLFLTNYTALDWTDPVYDGDQENKDWAIAAAEYASTVAYRWEWESSDLKRPMWDLWEMKP
jgi:hypothetical protein